MKQTISELTNIFSISNLNNAYNSDPWYLWTRTRIPSYINRRDGVRPLFPWIAYADNPDQEAAAEIDSLLEANAYKYRHLWELYVAKYNPIWNYEGTETETFTGAKSGTRDNTGTQTSSRSGSITGADTGTDTNVKSGSIQGADTGTDTNVKTGSLQKTMTGTDTNAKSGTDTTNYGKIQTEAATPYDSTSFLDAKKVTDSGSDSLVHGETDTETRNMTDTDTYQNLQDQRTLNTQHTDTFQNVQDQRTLNTTHTETYNNMQEQRTLNTQHTDTFQNVQDQRTLNTTHTETYNNLQDQRTDNLKEATSGSENYTITRTRGGNMGVTTTQQMQQEELAWVGVFNLVEIIASDICNEISYLYY